MTQSSCSSSHPVALDYENTLVLAIELSNANWVLAAQVPGLLRVKAKQTIEPRTEALWAAIKEPLQKASVNDRGMMRIGGALACRGWGNEAADTGDSGV